MLALPRVAALDPDVLKDAWLQASRHAHPDQTGGTSDQSSGINAAYTTLQSPGKRLKLLLELYDVAWRAVPLDSDTTDLFTRIGTALNSTQALLGRKSGSTSALALALFESEAMVAREQLETIASEIQQQLDRIEQSLPELDRGLQNGDAQTLTELQSIQTRLAYLEKWQAQIREALCKLI